MFGESTRWYDHIYHWLDYESQAAALGAVIDEHKTSPGNRLLDLACGTGKHLEQFRDRYEIEGLDLNPVMLEMARERLGDVPLHEGNFCDFDLGRRFDVITNLFSSIGYAKTRRNLDSAIGCVAKHLEPGGVALIEPWFTSDTYQAGTVHMLTIDEPEVKICRMNRSEVDGDMSVMEMHYLVGTPEEGVRHFTERHELCMFAVGDFERAAAAAGLVHEYGESERFRRGLHIFKQS